VHCLYTSERLHDVTVHKATIWIDNVVFFFTEQKRKEAVAAANSLTQALVDHLNVG